MAREGIPIADRARDRITGAWRSLVLRGARTFMPYATVRVDELVFAVPTHDDGPGGALFVWRQTPELSILPTALGMLSAHGESTDSKVLVDVGANIGTTTVAALARHGFGRAIALEPDPDNVRLLQTNIALNGLNDRAVVLAAAAGASVGRVGFGLGRQTRRGRRSGAGSLLRAAKGTADVALEVDVMTVDGVLAENAIEPEQVGLLWIDVQGHEGHVAEGAERVLTASRPFVFASRAAKLQQAGGFDRLVAAITANYAYVADLRPLDGRPPQLVAAASVAEVILGHKTTDILAFGSVG